MSAAIFSYEFFPPATALGERRFWRSLGCAETMDPAFFSITYGALGTGQERSISAIENVIAECDVPIAAHLTFEGSTRAEIDEVARNLSSLGVDRIVALRGDDRENAHEAKKRGACYEDVADFIAGLREIYPFDISVACYPETHPKAKNAQADLQELKRKCDAGADRAITQFFFEVEQFERFRDSAAAAGIDTPIVAGILPIKDFDKMTGFAKRCGSAVPDRLYKLFEPVKGNADLSASVAQQEMESMVDALIERDCNNFHIYTLNQPVILPQAQDKNRQRAVSTPVAAVG